MRIEIQLNIEDTSPGYAGDIKDAIADTVSRYLTRTGDEAVIRGVGSTLVVSEG